MALPEETRHVIKYDGEPHIKAPLPIDTVFLAEFCTARDFLRREELIGEHPLKYDGFGYGNMSQRVRRDWITDQKYDVQFVVTASQTSGVGRIDPAVHITAVTGVDLENEKVYSVGQLAGSSETLAHAVILSQDYGAVAHAHCWEISDKAEEMGLTVLREGIPYGTNELAYELGEQFEKAEVRESGIVVVRDHPHGIFAAAESPRAAAKKLIDAKYKAFRMLFTGGR